MIFCSAGLLVLMWPTRRWKAAVCSTANLWAALVSLHAAIWVWKDIFPESHSSVAQLWAGSSSTILTRWAIEFFAFYISVAISLLDCPQDDTEGDTENGKPCLMPATLAQLLMPTCRPQQTLTMLQPVNPLRSCLPTPPLTAMQLFCGAT